MKKRNLNLFYGHLFRHHRQSLGLTRAELGERLGITQVMLHYIETGQSPAQVALVEDLAAIVGVSVEELVYKAMVVYLYKI